MSKKLPAIFEIVIEKINYDGEGVGRYGNRSVFVFGAFLGEKVLVRPIKVSRGKVKAVIVEVLKAIPERRKEKNDHYLSSSPWQTLQYEKQKEYKIKSVKKVFQNEAGINLDCDLESGEQEWGYRNKMEYSFTKDTSGKVSLGFHIRGRRYDCYSLHSCAIAHDRINECAQRIVSQINNNQIPVENLKNLMIRYSYLENKCLAVLFVKDENFLNFKIDCGILKGWQIVYSDPRSPAAVITKILHQDGEEFIEEKVNWLKLKYSFHNFFQINVGVFSKLLFYLEKNISPKGVLIDLYSGVGTIGFYLSKFFTKVISVEQDEMAVKIAQENAILNNLKNITLYSGASEKQNLKDILKKGSTLVVDPPRPGLHPKVIKAILKIKPQQLIYVSCNPKTQAQDFNLLKKNYRIKKVRLFDLYPQTPHIESVVIAKKKIFGII